MEPFDNRLDIPIYQYDQSSNGLTDVSSSSNSTINKEDIKLDEVPTVANLQQTTRSSFYQVYLKPADELVPSSMDSNAMPYRESESFSRATFSLFSQQLLSPMWNAIAQNGYLSDGNDTSEAFTEDDNQIQNKVIQQLDPYDSVTFLQDQLPDYFVSFSTFLSKEDYAHYASIQDYNGIITFIHQQIHSIPFDEPFLLSCLEKLKIHDKTVLNRCILVYTLRELISIPHSSIQHAAYKILLSLSCYSFYYRLFILYKIHLFVIASFELSHQFHAEREDALSILNCWINHYCHSIPHSVIISIRAVASDPTDPLRQYALELLLRLFVENPEVMTDYDCLSVLLTGSIELHDHSLLQSSILACLFYLNTKKYRQTKALLDLQIILDPLLFEGVSVSTQMQDSIASSFYMSHIGLLTIMRSWSGLILFCSDIGGFNTYINILATRSDEYPQLGKDILSFLFTLLGIPTPNLLNEGEIIHQTTFWNECSIFINHIGFKSKEPGVNLLTTYLSLVVVILTKAKLPETLLSLLRHEDKDLVFLARSLLTVFTLLSDLFIPVTQTRNRSSLTHSLLLDQGVDSLQQNLASLSSPSIHTYPVIQHTTYVMSDVVDYFSWIALFNSILDSLSDNSYNNNPLFITDYICNSTMINHDLLSQTLHLLYNNQQQFGILLRSLNKECGEKLEKWDWNSLFSLMVITASSPHFINEFAKTRLMTRMEAFFAPQSGIAPFACQPITKESGLIVCCGVILFFVIVNADTQLISQSKKETFIHYYMRGLTELLHSTPESNSGLFSTLNLRYTNAYYYAIIAIHFLFSPRIQRITNLTGIQQSIFSVTQNPSILMHNNDFLLLFINHLHIANKSNSVERYFFGSFFDNGDLDIKRACIIRIQSVLCDEIENEEFIIWCLPYLCNHLDACESLTLLIVSILDSIVTLSPFIQTVVDALTEYHTKLSAVIPLVECEEFLTKLIATEGGFRLLEECYDYVSKRFDSFMESGIYLYVRSMENEFTTALLQNPSIMATSPFYLDHDLSLFVNPIRIQPPQNEVYRILRDERMYTQWFLEIPWRIEGVLCCKEEEIRLNADCSLDLSTPHLHPSGEDSTHSTIRIRGTFTNILTNSISTIELHEGDELRMSLQVGCESLNHNHLGSDFKSTNTNSLQFFQQLNSSKSDSIDAIRDFAIHSTRNPSMESISWNDLSMLIDQYHKDAEEYIHRVCREGSCCVWECRKDSKRGTIYVYAVEFITEFIPQKPRACTIHPHLFGCLFQTNLGVSFLKSRLDVVELCKMISDDNETLSNRRAVLWSVAHIAIQSGGLEFLQEECDCSFLDVVISLATESSVLSLRGTAFLVLSFLASSSPIRFLIKERGWFCESYSGNPVCYPLTTNSTLFNHVNAGNWDLPICTHFHSQKQMRFDGLEAISKTPRECAEESFQTPVCPSDILIINKEITKEEETVLFLVSSLSSVVLCMEAKRKLIEMRILSPSLFNKHRLFVYVHHLLSVSSLSRGWRRFVFELFSDLKWNVNGWKEFDKFPSNSSTNVDKDIIL